MSPLSFTRRGLIVGGAAVTANSVFISGCSSARSDEARAPWSKWNDPTIAGTPLAMVAAGILAANPHNTQPWLFHVGERSIDVFADTPRNLGAMDPMLREMHIGLGCAIENMCLAAAPNGFSAQVESLGGSLLELRDRRGLIQAATIHLSRASASDLVAPGYRAIPHRHTNRNPFDKARSVPASWRAELAGLAVDEGVRLFTFATGRQREAYDAAVVDATGAIIDDSPMIADSDRWFRATHAQIERYRSGPTLETAGLAPTTRLMAETIPLPASFKHQAWLEQTRDEQLASASMTGLIAVPDLYDRPSALAAGRIWQRIHLSATLAGVALQPLNQPMEVVDRDRQLGRGDAWARRMASLVGDAGWRPTFSFRAGIPVRTAGASPRRALADTLLSGGRV